MNAEIFIAEGTSGLWDQTNDVILIKPDGSEISLKITNDYKFDAGVRYTGTIVYTNNSKQIIWYELLPIEE